MTRDDIQNVMTQHPQLTAFGFGIYRERESSKEEHDAKFAKEREELLDSAAICTKVAAWIADQPLNKTVNARHGSYGWKHIVEDEIGEYVSNGQFIAAALYCGLTMKWDGRDANCAFNLAEAAYTNARKRAKEREAARPQHA